MAFFVGVIPCIYFKLHDDVFTGQCLNTLAVQREAHGVTKCHICGKEGNNVLQQSQYCILKAIEVFQWTGNCPKSQERFEFCCRNVAQQPSVHPTVSPIKWVGPHQACDLCHNSNKPSANSMVINMLYLGVGTCTQYYKYGREGRIPKHLCAPLQYFAFEPCGCD
jgi:hypothetical protein